MMIGQLLLTFREGLEAALVTAIVMTYLKRTGKRLLLRYVNYGVYLAIVMSLSCGMVIWFTYGVLSGASRALFEGAAALLAVIVLTSMICWMATKGKEIKAELKRRVETIMTQDTTLALASFSFIIMFREGLETVLFLTPFLLGDSLSTLTGAILGILASVSLAYLVFMAGMRISIRRFFTIRACCSSFWLVD